jgi:hypothetical protein
MALEDDEPVGATEGGEGGDSPERVVRSVAILVFPSR